MDDAKRPEGHEDELRPVTALFADLVGSTALGERLAADELKALVGECMTMMSRAVEEYGGVVQAYQGDGICVYFGVPVSHEDDPERAARAGLRILELVGDYGRDIAEAWNVSEFNVRVGINTGRVGVGLVGEGDPQAVALGDATNVAARLESVAQPGSIVVGEVTARRLTERFVFEDLGPTKVKGRTDPVTAFRLVAPKMRDEVAQAAPLIGRATERAALASAIDALVAGRGQVLLVTGDPGIGKTRLLEEMRSLAGERVTWLEGRCLSYGGLPSWPFVDILMSQLGIELGEPEIAMRTKARAKLSPDVLPSLARLLRIRLDIAPTREASLPPDEFREELRSSYGRWIAGLAARKPVVLALEDVQWADVSTRQLAEVLLELTDRAPVLIVVTMEIDPSSEGASLRLRVLDEYAHRAMELRLTPLSDDDAAELLVVLMPLELDARARSRLPRRAPSPSADCDGRRGLERTRLGKHVAEVPSLDVPHRDEEDAVDLARLVDRDDVRMVDRSREAGFAKEPLAEALVLGELGNEELQSNLAPEPHVFRAVDGAHAAAADQRLDAVPGELVSNPGVAGLDSHRRLLAPKRSAS